MTTFDAAAARPAPTVRLVPSPRRPDATGGQPVYHPRTIGIVDRPAETGQLPAYAQYAIHAQARPGRHRRPAPDLSAFLPFTGGAAFGGIVVVLAQIWFAQ